MKLIKKKLSRLSLLPKTWLIDLDGTIILHNSHICADNILLDKVADLWKIIPKKDKIILLSAREKKYSIKTINFLKKNKLRYDHIIFGLNVGERIVVNDKKPDGLKTALAINLKRNEGVGKVIKLLKK